MSVSKKNLAIVGLALILGLGIFFRFDNIGGKIFWHDEIFTKVFTAGYRGQEWKEALFTGNIVGVADLQKYLRYNPERSLLNTMQGLAREDPHHPPLYYGIARIWISCFGDSIITLRLLSAWLSLLAFPAIYLLCRELFEKRRVAWMAVALLAVSPLVLLYAQEAREYALWALLILFSNWALLRALRLMREAGVSRSKKILAWALYSLFMVLELYTSFSTASVIVAQSLYVLVRERFRITRLTFSFLAALGIALLLFLPWALVLMKHLDVFRASMSWSVETVIPRFELLKVLGMNLSRSLVDFGWDYDHLFTYGEVIGVFILIVYACYRLCRETSLKTSAMILALIIVPISMLFVPDLIWGGIRSVSARYFTPAFLGIILALSYLLATHFAETKIGCVLVVVIFSVSAASCLHNSRLEAVWTKGVSFNLHQVARAINESKQPLVVGNLMTYNPGNLLALSRLLKPETKFQLLPTEEGYQLPQNFSEVFFLNPSESFLNNLKTGGGTRPDLVFKDDFLRLWRLGSPSR